MKGVCNMYAVIEIHNYDDEITTVIFDDYLKAKAYLYWLWEDTYNRVLTWDAPLNEEQCFYDSTKELEHGKITWIDDDVIDFTIVEIKKPKEEFSKVDWKRYI